MDLLEIGAIAQVLGAVAIFIIAHLCNYRAEEKSETKQHR